MSIIASNSSLGSRSNKTNIFHYLSLLCSVAIIVLMFLPWLSITDSKTGVTENYSLVPGIIIECLDAHSLKTEGALDVLIFLIPILLITVFVHVMYIVKSIICMIKPEKQVTFPGTVSLLLAGLAMIMFFFTTDIAFKLITVTNASSGYTDDFFKFIATDAWTWVPVVWFLVALVQKLIFARFAHKKTAQ